MDDRAGKVTIALKNPYNASKKLFIKLLRTRIILVSNILGEFAPAPILQFSMRHVLTASFLLCI